MQPFVPAAMRRIDVTLGQKIVFTRCVSLLKSEQRSSV